LAHQPVEPSSNRATRLFGDLLEDLIDAVVNSPGPALAERRAAFAAEPMAEAPGAFAEKVRRRAYSVTDADIDSLRRDGMNEDAIFELTIACAVGESYSQLQVGLKAIRGRP
jgi:hypothetical protein